MTREERTYSKNEIKYVSHDNIHLVVNLYLVSLKRAKIIEKDPQEDEEVKELK